MSKQRVVDEDHPRFNEIGEYCKQSIVPNSKQNLHIHTIKFDDGETEQFLSYQIEPVLTPTKDPNNELDEVRELDAIQRKIWARINDEATLQGVKLSTGQAYCLASVIKEVLHPEVTALIDKKVTEARIDELKAPNDLLRSMYIIACREYALDGENTNWSPFINKLSDELEREHKIMYPERYATAQLSKPKEEPKPE